MPDKINHRGLTISQYYLILMENHTSYYKSYSVLPSEVVDELKLLKDYQELESDVNALLTDLSPPEIDNTI